MEKPSYYSILTAEVRYDNNLTDSEKLLFAEITSLSNKYGYCTASNNYFAKLYDVSKVTVSRRISSLRDNGYLHVELIKEGNEIKQRQLYPLSNVNRPIIKNDNTPINRNDKTPIIKNDKENNTSINNTSMNSVGEKQQVDNSKPKDKKINDKDQITKSLSLIQENYFNQITPIKLESLTTEIEQLGENAAEIISVAIDYTKDKSKNLNYLTKIINNWADDNVTTVEQAQEKINGKPSKFKNDWIEQALKELEND